MDIKGLLAEARAIWGEKRHTLQEIVVRLAVSLGDLSRVARGADKDRATDAAAETKKELGNVIFSAIRWADDLGYDPEECVRLAMEAQRKFAATNPNR